MTLMALGCLTGIDAQTKQWTLRECEDYAVANSITVKQREVAREKQEYSRLTCRLRWVRTSLSDAD